MAKRESKVAVVTGSNKGIGFEIVRQLASKGFTTVLTARDAKRGIDALERLKSQGLEAEFHQLDVSSSQSVSAMAAWLQQKFGAIDILVNNAGIKSKGFENEVEGAQALFETNYYGAKRMAQAVLPIIKPGGRIINISSRLGQLNNDFLPLKNEFQVAKFSDAEHLSEQVIDLCLQEFRGAVERGKVVEEGYPNMDADYCMSKFALNAYTRILAQKLQNNKISVNSVCPGYTKTDLTGGEGHFTAEQGADTPVWLATLEAEDYPSGKFFAERKEIHF
ncbi:hypothetical protein SELMODRAFT_271617 [Selaginella moellendorffii]|uniref:Uncharacterized protein n=1 Tax=Selaginella moellendorffii TaxID=88036 RepID=D8SIX0_SELML|nr:(+)-neomenthol dehydrogenase [Selaginella moellendorffii]EFJ15569.1 hypothetical protein SELMODRAFT_271617 [Selaginella moellendorffii]|eukprot:XP_002983227.1 (+)-neomenthol dehydrogenase [Selaginella moellendorffii]